MYMDYSSKRISPVAGRKVSLSQHGSDPLSNGPVSLFCNTILMGFISHSVLTSYAFSSKESLKFPRHVFTTLVISESHDLASKELLYECFELLECLKDTRLVRELLDNPEATVVINECDPVLVSSSVLDWELMDI